MLPSLLLLLTAIAPQSADECAAKAPGTAATAFVVLAARQPRDTTVSATVCIVPAKASSVKIGSYHGELYFDSTAVSVVRVEKPAGGVRVENATLKGQVNFAGAAPSGFPGRALVKVILRVRGPSARPSLRLAMKELNTTAGTSLMKELVVAEPPR